MIDFKFLCIVDSKSDSYIKTITSALDKIKANYSESTGGKVNFIYKLGNRNLSGLKWEEYLPNAHGISMSWIKEVTKEIWNRWGWGYDCVSFIIDDSNWYKPEENIYGWNLGLFYNNYQVQLIRGLDNERTLYFTFLMEIFHSMDDFYKFEFDKSLEQFFGVNNFDEDIVHDYEIAFFRDEYKPYLKQMAQVLVNILQNRRRRETITVIQKLLLLYKKLLYIFQEKYPSAVKVRFNQYK